MTATSIPGAGPSGVLRMTWVRDQLAHVLDHCETDEPSGTWTGLACPDHGLPLGADVDTTTLQRLSARGGEIADLIWEAPADLAAGHGQLFQAAIHAYNAGDSGRAQQLWDKAQAIWSQAWAANHAALELVSTPITPATPGGPRRSGTRPRPSGPKPGQQTTQHSSSSSTPA